MTTSTDGASRPSNVPLLVAAFMASLTTGGTTYGFGIYGAALKHTLQLSQSELDTISSANFCAGLLSGLPGMCSDRFGPRCALSTGGICGAVALLLYWAVAKQMIPVDRSFMVAVLSTLGVMVFMSSSLVTGAVFKLIVATCGPGTKGAAVGAAKGFVGLGAGTYAILFQSLRGNGLFESDLDFLPLAAICALVAATLPALCLLPSKKSFDENPRTDRSTSIHTRTLYLGLVALAILVVGNSVLELFFDDSEQGPDYVMAVLILLVWFGPILALLFLPESSHTLLATQISLVPLTEKRTRFRDEAGAEDSGEEDDEGPLETVHSGPTSRNLFEMLCTLPAWLMLWTTTILVGGGTIMTNNMGQMTEALHFAPVVSPAALALFSVFQAGSRVVTGAVSESALTWRCAWPRPAFFIVASLIGVFAHVVLANATSEGPFVVGVILSGIGFGMVWPLMVLIVGELYGKDHVGANYMFYDGFTSAVGTLAISKYIAQEVYEEHIDGGGSPDNYTCYGIGCFQMSHLIVAALSTTCVFTSICVLCTRLSKESYSNLQ
jgi:MFS family permease